MWVEGEAVCNFSKDHKGRRLRDIASTDPGFLSWIIGKDFILGVKREAAKAPGGEFPQIGYRPALHRAPHHKNMLALAEYSVTEIELQR